MSRKQAGRDIIITSLNLFKYVHTDNIFHTKSSYHEELLIRSEFEFKIDLIDFEKEDPPSYKYELEYLFNFGKQMDEIIEERREIEDFVSIISRVGGFLAFFKISAILFILHQYLYERKVVADMKGGAKS